jgi:hypothetical protein
MELQRDTFFTNPTRVDSERHLLVWLDITQYAVAAELPGWMRVGF